MIYAIIISIACLLLSLYVTRNILAPSTIVAGIWLFCILAYWLYPHVLSPLNGNFYIGISIWVGDFTIAALLIQSLSLKTSNKEQPNLKIRNLYFYISIISFPIALWNIYSMTLDLGITKNILFNLRQIAVGSIKGMKDGTSQNYFATLWLVAYAIELLHYQKNRIWQLIVLLIINLFWATAVMAKINFLSIFITTLSILYLKDIIKPKTIYISAALIFVFFVGIQVIRTPNATKKEDLKYDFFSLYVLSGLPAFETVKPNSSDIYGESTFRFFYTVSNKIGLSEKKPENALLPFTIVSKKKEVYSNTYTVLYPFYKDFGFNGIIFFAIISGLFYGYIYKKMTKKNNPMIITYSTLLTTFICQFLSEGTISTLSFTIQLILLSHIPYWVNRFVFRELK